MYLLGQDRAIVCFNCNCGSCLS